MDFDLFEKLSHCRQHPTNPGWYHAQDVIGLFGIAERHTNNYLKRHCNVNNFKRLAIPGKTGAPAYFMNTKAIWEFILKPYRNERISREIVQKVIDKLSEQSFEDHNLNALLTD